MSLFLQRNIEKLYDKKNTKIKNFTFKDRTTKDRFYNIKWINRNEFKIDQESLDSTINSQSYIDIKRLPKKPEWQLGDSHQINDYTYIDQFSRQKTINNLIDRTLKKVLDKVPKPEIKDQVVESVTTNETAKTEKESN